MSEMDIIDPPVKASDRIESKPEELESDEHYTRLIFKTFLFFSILALVIFGIKNALIGALVESGLNFATAGVAVGIIYAQRFVRRTAHLRRASLMALGILFFYIAGVGGHSGYKILWVNLFPLVAFFMMGSREGLGWSLAFLAGMVFWLSDANTLVSVYPYEAVFRARIPMVYLTTTVLMYAYEKARRVYQRGLNQKRNQLLAEKQKLVLANGEIAASSERIQQSERQYKLVVDNAHDAIFISQDERIRFVNPTARHFFGIQDEAPLDLPLADFIHPRDREVVMTRHRARVRGGDAPNHYVFRVVNRTDRQSRWLRINAVPIEWNGRSAVICFCHDITQTKSLEMQLLQAQKMQAIGSLAGGIAHDFNNMLSAIVGYTEMAIASDSVDATVRGRLDRVLEASDRARGLIGQILAFSRQQSEESRPVAVAPVVKDALGLLQATKAPDIEIQTNLDDGSGVVFGDGTQIHQVVMNLCTNALHAMKENGGRLTVSLDRIALKQPSEMPGLSLPLGDYIHLKIEDTGCGMDPSIQHRIFDPYFTTKKKGEGTGLGLSVVHGIVKSHEGAITVASETGRGTTFEVYLPRSDMETDTEVAHRVDALPVGTETILLVDDEEIVTEITQESLESLGYQVVARVSSIEAYNAFCAAPERFQAVIVDQNMPGMTGLELAAKISARRKGLPIVMCTGFSADLSPSKLKQAGIDTLLNKPVLRRELAVTLRKLLDSAAGPSIRKAG